MAGKSEHAPLASQRQPLVRRLAVQDLGPGERHEEIETTAAERAAIADLLGLVGLDALSADLSLRRWRGGGIALSGVLRAHVVQSCVVTLEPVPADIHTEFERRYLPADLLAERPDRPAEEIFVDPAADEPPEPLENGYVEVGAALVEELALALDPYPRAPGAVLDDGSAAAEEAAAHPFAALAGLRLPE